MHTRKDHMHIGSHVHVDHMCTQGITNAHRITHMTTCTQDHTRLAEHTHVHKIMRAQRSQVTHSITCVQTCTQGHAYAIT